MIPLLIFEMRNLKTREQEEIDEAPRGQAWPPEQSFCLFVSAALSSVCRFMCGVPGTDALQPYVTTKFRFFRNHVTTNNSFFPSSFLFLSFPFISFLPSILPSSLPPSYICISIYLIFWNTHMKVKTWFSFSILHLSIWHHMAQSMALVIYFIMNKSILNIYTTLLLQRYTNFTFGIIQTFSYTNNL